MRVILAVASHLVFSAIGYTLVVLGRLIAGDAVPSWLLKEGGILISAVVGLLAGIWLAAGVTMRGVRRGTRGASGSREVEHQPRIR